MLTKQSEVSNDLSITRQAEYIKLLRVVEKASQECTFESATRNFADMGIYKFPLL